MPPAAAVTTASVTKCCVPRAFFDHRRRTIPAFWSIPFSARRYRRFYLPAVLLHLTPFIPTVLLFSPACLLRTFCDNSRLHRIPLANYCRTTAPAFHRTVHRFCHLRLLPHQAACYLFCRPADNCHHSCACHSANYWVTHYDAFHLLLEFSARSVLCTCRFLPFSATWSFSGTDSLVKLLQLLLPPYLRSPTWRWV